MTAIGLGLAVAKKTWQWTSRPTNGASSADESRFDVVRLLGVSAMVAALAMKPNLPFVHRSSLAARVSRMLTEAGDVDPLGDA